VDIGYWIFILIAYLVSQWLRKRAQSFRQPPPEHQPAEQEPENKQKDTVPQFLRSLGIDELFEEIKAELRPDEASYEEADTGITEVADLDEDFEFIDETVVESEAQPEAAKGFEQETGSEWLPAELAGRKKRASHSIHAYFESRADLRNLILMKEILGPPRAIERHRFRRYF